MRPEYPLPTELQRQAICELFHYVFVELRSLSNLGKSEQIFDLTDLFHNVPNEIYGCGRWDPLAFRSALENYQRKYAGSRMPRDYVSMFDEAFGSELAPLIQFESHLDSLPAICEGIFQSPAGSHELHIRIVHYQAIAQVSVGKTPFVPPEGYYQRIGSSNSIWSSWINHFPNLR